MKKPAGVLTVICGSMFAGKSEELIRRARRALYAKKKVQVFKPTVDSRYDQRMVVTHMGVAHEAQLVRNTAELRKRTDADSQVILVEEAQFFDIDIVRWAVDMADSGKEVILAGLDQDFRREPFGPMPYLMAAADEVVKLRAICMSCGSVASHTYRVIGGQPAHRDDPVILIGAQESYEARCRSCYRLLSGKRSKPRRDS